MILTSRGRISRSCGRVRMLAWAPSKEVWVNDDREPSCDSRVRNRDNTLIQYWLLRCLALPILAALWWVPAAAQCTAYVPTHKSNSVAVIDTLLDRVVAMIPVQIQPLGVAITPNGTVAYVANLNSNSVSVISTVTNTVTATIGVGTGPWGVAITPSGAFAYTANLNSNNVTVIDTATNTVVATVPAGNGPVAVALTPSGAFAYVTNESSDNVSVISTATNTVVATVPVVSG